MRVEGPSGLLGALLVAQAGNLPTSAPEVTMLVSIAASAPEEQRRRDALKSADAGVSGLAALHGDLMRGVVSPEPLPEWARWRQRPDEPELPRCSTKSNFAFSSNWPSRNASSGAIAPAAARS